ncbi:Ig-like domain-containing protein [Rhodococcus xishaensis]|nr:Ig-like domain-containing protein [Rhodococcus xishaensis]
MTGRTSRRLTAGAAVAALSATLLGGFSPGLANAASESVTWSDGNSKFTRTVSDTTASVGQIIEVKTKFERSGVLEIIYEVTDHHPSCWEFVSSNKSNPQVESDYTRVSGSWNVWPNINPNSQTFTFEYRVTEDCARDTPLSTGMSYDGSLGAGSYTDKGPTVTVAKDTTTTSLAAVPSPLVVGQLVTLTATVTGGAQGDPVDFYNGDTKIGSGELDASGVATYDWAPATGTWSVQAMFPSTAKAKSSESAAQNVQVNDPVSTDVVVSVPGTAVAGETVDLTAQVSPTDAQGTVQFADNGAPIGDQIEVVDGAATLPYTFSAGQHSITAEFFGAFGFTNSTAAPQTVTVTDAATTAAVTVPEAAQTGDPVTLSASISPTPTGGTVQFKDGLADIGTPVELTDGTAILEHTFTSVGSHAISAYYSGTAGFAPATAPAQSVSVTDPVVAPRDTVTLLSVPGEAKTDEVVDLWVTVRDAAGDPVDGGTVQFRAGGQDLGDPVAVSDGVARLPHTFSAVGTHAISAVFSGTAALDGSTTVTRNVNVTVPTQVDVDTATALTVPASAAPGDTVTLWASVVSSVPVEGTIQFFDGETPIGETVDLVDGTATLDYAFTITGAHSITAVYSGAEGLKGSTSEPRTLDVASVDPAPGDTSSLGGLPFGS